MSTSIYSHYCSIKSLLYIDTNLLPTATQIFCTLYRDNVATHILQRCRECWLQFAWVVDDAKGIVVTRVCVCVCLCVCLSAAACLHYCTDPDVTWGNGRGCPLVVHYWADLQSVHGLCCYGNVTRTRNVSDYMLILTPCLVTYCKSIAVTMHSLLFNWLFDPSISADIWPS